jgi:hypothetical protein
MAAVSGFRHSLDGGACVTEERFDLTEKCLSSRFAKVNSRTNPSTLLVIQDKLTDLWGNGLLQNENIK